MNNEGRPTSGQFCWNELATSNVQAAKDFYGKMFGWKFYDQNMGHMTYTMIKVNDKDIGGIWAIPNEQQKQIPPHWMSYVLVENCDEAVAKASQHGAAIIKPATNVGECGRFAIITDPTGAHIALWETVRVESAKTCCK